MQEQITFKNYWKRKTLLRTAVPDFPVKRWWPTNALCESEKVCFEAAREARNILDFGAGNLQIMEKFKAAGFRGEYDTLDIGEEFSYSFRSLDEVSKTYEAILCLDVIEHLPLAEGLGLILRLVDLLTPGGVLLIQTPNARCVRNPLSWDMTHVHIYNAHDLWAYLSSLGLRTKGYRIVFQAANTSRLRYAWFLVCAFVITRILGCDYADNILMIVQKP